MKVETQSQNWSSKLWPQPEGERVISAAARSFGAMFSCMCFFCSGDLPVPLSPSLKRNIFQNNREASEGSEQEGEGQSHLWPSGGCWRYAPVCSGRSYCTQYWPAALAGCHFICLPSQVWDPELLLRDASYTVERAGSQTPLGSQQVSPLLCRTCHSSCTGREPGPGFTFFRVLMESLGH